MSGCVVERNFLNVFSWTVVEHDWQVVENTCKGQIEREVDRESEKSKIVAPVSPSTNTGDYLEKKVCLRCGAVIDQIEKYRDVYRALKQQQAERHKLALEILQQKEVSK